MALLNERGVPMQRGGPGQFVPYQCAACGQTTNLLVPKPEIINVVSYSAFHFPHEIPQSCEHCGQKYVFKLASYNPQSGFMFGFQPVEERGKILTAPAGAIPDIKGNA